VTDLQGVFAKLMACLMGIIAFNVLIGVFGDGLAIIGLAACIGMTVWSLWRRPPEEEDTHAEA
jgi:hypothetical protein